VLSDKNLALLKTFFLKQGTDVKEKVYDKIIALLPPP